jgi:hypothetical protein
MTDRFPASHADHDPLLVAAFAAGDLAPADLERAVLLAYTCSECALLEADLRAIATATAALPKALRTRDFSLSARDAARLRRRGWRGLVGTLAGPRSAALKPLATGLTTLGIAGLLLAALPAMQLGGSAAPPPGPAAPAAAPSGAGTGSDTNGFAPAASAAPTRLRAYGAESEPPRDSVPVSRPVGSPVAVEQDRGDAGPGVAGGEPSAQPEPAAPPVVPAPTAPVVRGPSPLAVLSAAFLVLGLALFVIRWTARRLSDG